jgi:hypothetical protein
MVHFSNMMPANDIVNVNLWLVDMTNNDFIYDDYRVIGEDGES